MKGKSKMIANFLRFLHYQFFFGGLGKLFYKIGLVAAIFSMADIGNAIMEKYKEGKADIAYVIVSVVMFTLFAVMADFCIRQIERRACLSFMMAAMMSKNLMEEIMESSKDVQEKLGIASGNTPPDDE